MESKKQEKKQQESTLSKDAHLDEVIGQVHGAYIMQPITKPDRRFPETNVARPSDESVEENRNWVNFNEK